jgi:hypothetical protein
VFIYSEPDRTFRPCRKESNPVLARSFPSVASRSLPTPNVHTLGRSDVHMRSLHPRWVYGTIRIQAKSLPVYFFADPHPLTPVVPIFYKKGGGMGCAHPKPVISRQPAAAITHLDATLTKNAGGTSFKPPILPAKRLSVFSRFSTFGRSDVQTFRRSEAGAGCRARRQRAAAQCNPNKIRRGSCGPTGRS